MSIESYDEFDSGYDNLWTKLILNDLPELFAGLAELIAARDGESTLLAQVNALQAAIATLVLASGIKITSNDTTLGVLNDKLLLSDFLTKTEGNDGGNETLTLDIDLTELYTKFLVDAPITKVESGDAAETMTLGISAASTTAAGKIELATNTEAAARSASDRAITPSNLPNIFKVKIYEFVPIEWAEEGVTSTAAVADTTTSGNGAIRSRDFSGDATDDLIIPWLVPDNMIVANGIKFYGKCLVTAATGPSSEGVALKLAGYSAGDGDPVTGTFGTAVESTSTGMTHAQNDFFNTTLSGEVTITDLAVGEVAMLQLKREHDNAADTYVQELGICGITIVYDIDLGAAG